MKGVIAKIREFFSRKKTVNELSVISSSEAAKARAEQRRKEREQLELEKALAAVRAKTRQRKALATAVAQPASPPAVADSAPPHTPSSPQSAFGIVEAITKPDAIAHPTLAEPTGTMFMQQQHSTPGSWSTPEKDAWEDWADEVYDPYGDQGRKIKATIEMTYLDRSGNETSRMVDITRYVHDTRDGIFHGR